MISLYVRLTVLVPWIMVLFLAAEGVQAQSSPLSVEGQRDQFEITVVASTADSMRILLTVHGHTIEEVLHDQDHYQQIVVQGMTFTQYPGAPQLPTHGVLLGTPTHEGLVVEVIDQETESLYGYRIPPAPSRQLVGDSLSLFPGTDIQETYSTDPSIYASDAFYPHTPVVLTEGGYMRDQAVAQLQFTPVRVNPLTEEVQIYRRLVVDLRWPAQTSAASTRRSDPSPAYESMLAATLLNYGSLGRTVSAEGVVAAAVVETQVEHAVMATPRLKVVIQDEGIYRLTHADLKQAGFDLVGFDPSFIRMHVKSEEIAIHMTGVGDGSFDPGDAILFYGQSYRDRYTDENVYWVSIGEGSGLRMAGRDVAPTAGEPIARHFFQTAHFEKDSAYWQAMAGQNVDRWFWETRLSPNSGNLDRSRKYEIELENVETSEYSATVRVQLKGYTSQAHRTRIHLNDRQIDEKSWSGQTLFVHTVTIPQNLLHNGSNHVKVETLDAGAPADQILVDWIEIDYWRKLAAVDGRLIFSASAPGFHRFQLSAFDASPFRVFDVSDPWAPVILNGVVRSDDRLSYEDNASEVSRYVALNRNRYFRPLRIVLDAPSNLRSSQNGADYLIVTHEDFVETAEELASHRQAAGLRTVVVSINDIYDEFSHGRFDPEAIRTFLTYAYAHWTPPAPTYVLLLGDANQDYKDNLNNGTAVFVPSQNFDSQLFGEVSSDSLFANVSGNDALPDLFIGRLPAQSAQEAQTMVRKIIAYDRMESSDDWHSRTTFVADDKRSFADTSEQLINAYPYYYRANRLYLGNGDIVDPTSAIVDGFNRGSLFLTYIGHGEHFGWGIDGQGGGQIFDVDDVGELANSTRPAIVVVGNCLNGFFAGPKENPSLAEVLLRHNNGGAVAVFAPTSLGYAGGHRILLNRFYRAIYHDDRLSLGSAATQAKIATYGQNSFWRELIDTYILFGDPVTQPAMPANFPYVIAALPDDGTLGHSLDQPLHIEFNKPVNERTISVVAEPSGGGTAGAPIISNIHFTPTWNAAGTSVRFDHTDFVHGLTYSLAVRGYDHAGNEMGPGTVANPWHIGVTTDDKSPTAVITADGSSSDRLLTTSPLTLTFDEPVRPDSVHYTIDPEVRSHIRWNVEHTHATILHSRFAVGKQYTLSLLKARDDAGNWLEKPASGLFIAGETYYNYLSVVAVD